MIQLAQIINVKFSSTYSFRHLDGGLDEPTSANLPKQDIGSLGLVWRALHTFSTRPQLRCCSAKMILRVGARDLNGQAHQAHKGAGEQLDLAEFASRLAPDCQLSEISSPLSTDDDVDSLPTKSNTLDHYFKNAQPAKSAPPPKKKRPPSPPHDDAFPKSLPNYGPQDIENGVVESLPSEQVERLLCALLGLVLNRKKDIEYVIPPP
ncbi:MAG: hypothetical protein Q9170_002745 [Blastenia crenularia]